MLLALSFTQNSDIYGWLRPNSTIILSKPTEILSSSRSVLGPGQGPGQGPGPGPGPGQGLGHGPGQGQGQGQGPGQGPSQCP